MTADADEPSGASTLQVIAKKIRSQILLFSIAIAIVIVLLIQTAGVNAALPIGAVLVVFLVGTFVHAKVERPWTGGERLRTSAGYEWGKLAGKRWLYTGLVVGFCWFLLGSCVGFMAALDDSYYY